MAVCASTADGAKLCQRTQHQARKEQGGPLMDDRVIDACRRYEEHKDVERHHIICAVPRPRLDRRRLKEPRHGMDDR